MRLPTQLRPSLAPRRTLVATATFASQLFGASVFTLALVWIIALRGTGDLVIAALVVSAFVVFAGGHAHRGGVVPLALCAVFDLAVGIALLLRVPPIVAFTAPPMTRVSEALARHHDLVIVIVGGAAIATAIAAVLALPQARRFAAWHREQLHRVAHLTPSGLIARLHIEKTPGVRVA